MPQNEVSLPLNLDAFAAKIQQARNMVKELRSEIDNLNTSSIDSGSPEAARIRSSIASAGGSESAVRGTGAPGAVGGATSASRAASGSAYGYTGPASVLRDFRSAVESMPGVKASYVDQIAQGLGLQRAPDLVQSVVRSAQASALVGSATAGGLGPEVTRTLLMASGGAGGSTGMVTGGFGPSVAQTLMMPTTPWTTFNRTGMMSAQTQQWAAPGSGMVPLGQTQMMTPMQVQSAAWYQRQGFFEANPGALNAARGIGIGIGAGFYSGMNTLQGEAATGRPDMAGRYGAVARGVGGVIGGAVAGPWGAAIGQQILGSVTDWLTAGQTRTQSALLSMMPQSALMGEDVGDNVRTSGPMGMNVGRTVTSNTTYARLLRLQSISARLMPTGSSFAPERGATDVDLANTWSTVTGGMLAGGLDPRAGMGFNLPYRIPGTPGTPGTRSFHDWRNPISPDAIRMGRDEVNSTGGFRLIRDLVGVGMMAIGHLPTTKPGTPGTRGTPDQFGMTDDVQYAEYISGRLAARYGKLAPEMARTVAPIFGSIPETGGSPADILARYGPEASARFFDTIDSKLPGTDVFSLSVKSAAFRTAQRSARMSSLSTSGGRGIGQATAYRSQMDTLSGIPGGRDSMAYAEARANLGDSMDTAYSEADLGGYRMTSMRLGNLRERANASPYGPGNLYAIDLATANVNTGRVSQLRSRMADLQRNGLLSPERRYSMQSEIEGAITQNYQIMGELADPMANRLPALAAGTNSYRRFDSMQLAAANIGAAGLPIRSFGAMGGAQARMQQQFIESFGLGHQNPRSRTQGINNGGNGDMGQDILAVLQQMLSEIQKQNGQGGNSFDRVPRGKGAGLAPDSGQSPTASAQVSY